MKAIKFLELYNPKEAPPPPAVVNPAKVGAACCKTKAIPSAGGFETSPKISRVAFIVQLPVIGTATSLATAPFLFAEDVVNVNVF